MKDLVDKAAVLVEALPYMRRFFGKVIVVKYGGHAMSDDALRASFAVDVVLLKFIGVQPVIVHGGGPQIAATLDRLGKQSTFVDGLRAKFRISSRYYWVGWTRRLVERTKFSLSMTLATPLNSQPNMEVIPRAKPRTAVRPAP